MRQKVRTSQRSSFNNTFRFNIIMKITRHTHTHYNNKISIYDHKIETSLMGIDHGTYGTSGKTNPTGEDQPQDGRNVIL